MGSDHLRFRDALVLFTCWYYIGHMVLQIIFIIDSPEFLVRSDCFFFRITLHSQRSGYIEPVNPPPFGPKSGQKKGGFTGSPEIPQNWTRFWAFYLVKSRFLRSKIAKFSRLRRAFPLTNPYLWTPKSQNFPPAAG